jgi:hypothetical protein
MIENIVVSFLLGWGFGMLTAYVLWEGKTGFFEKVTFMLRKRDRILETEELRK